MAPECDRSLWNITRSRVTDRKEKANRFGVPVMLLAVAFAVGVAVALAIPPSVRAQSQSNPGSNPSALLGDPISGTSSYVSGTYVWTDYAYDDRGASSSSGSDGSAAYPTGLSNAADLIQLQLSETPSGLQVRAILETLLDSSVPILAVGFDTDQSPATGAATLPGGRWTTQGSLGLEQLVVITGSGGKLLSWKDGAWVEAGEFSATVDPVTNVMEATVPTNLLNPGTATWNAVAPVGVVDSSGHSFLDGGEPIFDLAFVGAESATGWQDSRQGDILAGRLPASDAVAAVDFSMMAAGTTESASATSPGFHSRLYRSSLQLGEGIQQSTITLPGGVLIPDGNLYAGPYQPYLVWIPDNLPSPPPLVVYMHGFTQTHTSNSSSFGPAQPGFTPQGLVLGNGGFTPPAVVVFPLGRGEDTFYFGPAEQDVIDVTDDAIARYGIDQGRIVLSGVSMGGFGTFRLGVRYPDRWSALVPFIGTGGSPQYEFGAVPRPVLDQVFSPTGFPTGNAELLENLADLPMRMINGQIDPLVNNVLVTQDVLRLDQLGYDYRSWVLLRRNHEVVPSLSNCVFLEALTHARDTDPARVVLSVEPSMFMFDPTTGLDLRYDHAYWVSGVEIAQAASKGTVDATSLARADRSPAANKILTAGQNLTSGADLCGPNPAVQTGDAWRKQGIELTPGESQPTSNGAEVSLAAVTSAILDLSRMELTISAPLTLSVTADRTSELVLVGPWTSPVTETVDGQPAGTLSPSTGAIVLPIEFGSHVYLLSL